MDIDPLSVAYAEIAANTESTTVDGVRGDLLNPGTFWGTEQTQSLLDAGTPTCLIMTGVLDTIADTPALVDALTRYTERLVPGSLIIVSHASIDGLNPDDPAQATLASHMRAVCEFYRHTHTPARVLRTTAQLTQILDRLTLLEPGIVPTRAWNNPDTRADLTAATSLCLAAVAEVPV